MTQIASENGSNGRNELDRCKTCEHTRMWHDTNDTRHVFNDGSVSPQATFGRRRADGSKEPLQTSQQPAESAGEQRWPFDPVLRQALINRGVITAEDLRSAEEQIRAVTAAFESGVKK